MTFEDFKFHPDLNEGVQDMRFVQPTPVQEQAIPPAMEGKDVIANAQTGSGKTAAFLLPLMHRVISKSSGKTRILVLAPTRELACQIDEQAVGFGYHTWIKSASVYGGVRMEMQERALLSGTTIIIATPGRLLDHHKYGSWRFDELEALVLDEADRMLDMGFWPDIQAIMKKLPAKKQMLLFSATMPEPIVKVARTMMTDPVHIKIGRDQPPSAITQHLYPVSSHMKVDLLVHLLKKTQMKSTIVFVATKIGADRLHRALHRAGLNSGVIHGDREQAERDKVILSFKGGKIQTLVATDVASRGIDIGGISHVINFDIPNDTDSYIHRIGRTARAKAEGDAFTFFTPEEEDRVKEIEEAVGMTIPRVVIPGFQEATRQFNHPPPGRRPRDGKFRRSRTPARGEFRRKHPDPKNPKRAF